MGFGVGVGVGVGAHAPKHQTTPEQNVKVLYSQSQASKIMTHRGDQRLSARISVSIASLARLRFRKHVAPGPVQSQGFVPEQGRVPMEALWRPVESQSVCGAKKHALGQDQRADCGIFLLLKKIFKKKKYWDFLLEI